MYFPWSWIIVKYHDMNRATLIEQIAEARTALEKLLTLLQSTPVAPDRFASHLYQSRREYRRACETAGKSGKQIERCVIHFVRWLTTLEDLCGWRPSCRLPSTPRSPAKASGPTPNHTIWFSPLSVPQGVSASARNCPANRASKSSGAPSRHSRLPKVWAFKGEFRQWEDLLRIGD